MTITCIDELTKKLSEKIGEDAGKDDKIAENLIRYIIGEENEMPDLVKFDHDLEIFVKFYRDYFARAKKLTEEEDKDYLENWETFIMFVGGIFVFFPTAVSAGSLGLSIILAALGAVITIDMIFTFFISTLVLGAVSLCVYYLIKQLPNLLKSSFPDQQIYKYVEKLKTEIQKALNEAKDKIPLFKKNVNNLEKEIKTLQTKIKNSNVIQNNEKQRQNLYAFVGLNYNENINLEEPKKQANKTTNEKVNIGNQLKASKSEPEKNKNNINKYNDDQKLVNNADNKDLKQSKKEIKDLAAAIPAKQKDEKNKDAIGIDNEI